MNIARLKIEFYQALKEEYPPEEKGSFFYLLTEAYLKLNRLQIALEPDVEVSEGNVEKFNQAIERLLQHEPIQYIIGETEFFGLKFLVNKNVLIPRPETEELVQWIVDDIGENAASANLKILDIGTGSGCIAISLAKALPQAKITAMDVSKEALNTARKNAMLNNVAVTFTETNILEQQDLERNFDIVVSNPPYVRELEKKEMQQNVLKHEPATALYVEDTDPLIFYRKITELANAALPAGGKIYFEINQYLGTETNKLLQPYFETTLRKDIFGNDRMLRGVKN